MVLISSFKDASTLGDEDYFILEQKGQPDFTRLSWVALKSFLGVNIRPSVNPIARYRADSGVSQTQGTITKWANSLGVANDLVPSRNTIFWVDAQINSKAVVRLNANAFFASANIFSGIREIFVVCNHREAGSVFGDFRRLVDFGDNSGSFFGVSGGTAYSPKSFPRNVNAATLRINGRLTDSATPLNSYRLINFQFDTPVSNKLWVGTYSGTGAQLFLGDVADILLFDSWLDIKEKFAWQNELMNFWNIK